MTHRLPLIASLVAMAAIASPPAAYAQAAGPSGTSLSSQLGVHVFPAKSQSSDKQHLDELHCYDWSKARTNFDPLAPATAPTTPASTTTSASSSAYAPSPGPSTARGAAAGAAIGAIGGNAGKGAAIGATAGVLRGLHHRRVASEQQAEQEQAAAAQQNAVNEQAAARTQDFKRAFAACLQGKGYTVR